MRVVLRCSHPNFKVIKGHICRNFFHVYLKCPDCGAVYDRFWEITYEKAESFDPEDGTEDDADSSQGKGLVQV